MARAAEAEWSERVARWKSSGLSTREFAAAEGVNASSLAWWKWKLGKRGRRSTKRSSAASEPVTFVQLRPASTGPVEILLASGHLVPVPHGADVELVAHLVAALDRGAR